MKTEKSFQTRTTARLVLVVDGTSFAFAIYMLTWVHSRYCKVFQYLLRLKRTQLELEKSWASVMHQDHTYFAKHRNDRINYSKSQQRRQTCRPMWRVREHMAFLIRNLQFYIQVLVPYEFTFNFSECHAVLWIFKLGKCLVVSKFHDTIGIMF